MIKNNKMLSVSAIGLFFSISVIDFAKAGEAVSTATWEAKASKRTESKLTVEATDSLQFNYIESSKNFSIQDGAFSVKVDGIQSTPDFELTAVVASSTLNNRSNNGDPIIVGVYWNGEQLPEVGKPPISLFKKGRNSAGLDALNGSGVVNDRSNFRFAIDRIQNTDKAKTKDFSSLPDGFWDGQVKVKFVATWTTPETKPQNDA